MQSTPWSQRESPSLAAERQALADEMCRRTAAAPVASTTTQRPYKACPTFSVGQLMDAMMTAQQQQQRARPLSATSTRIVHSNVPLTAGPRRMVSSSPPPHRVLSSQPQLLSSALSAATAARLPSSAQVVRTVRNGVAVSDTVAPTMHSTAASTIATSAPAVHLTQNCMVAQPTTTSVSALPTQTRMVHEQPLSAGLHVVHAPHAAPMQQVFRGSQHMTRTPVGGMSTLQAVTSAPAVAAQALVQPPQPNVLHASFPLAVGHAPHAVQVIRDPVARVIRAVPLCCPADDGYLYSPEYYEDWYNFYACQEYYWGREHAPGQEASISTANRMHRLHVVPPPRSKLRNKQDGKWFEFVRNKGGKGPAAACTSKFTQEGPAMPTHDRSLTSAGAVRAEVYTK